MAEMHEAESELSRLLDAEPTPAALNFRHVTKPQIRTGPALARRSFGRLPAFFGAQALLAISAIAAVVIVAATLPGHAGRSPAPQSARSEIATVPTNTPGATTPRASTPVVAGTPTAASNPNGAAPTLTQASAPPTSGSTLAGKIPSGNILPNPSFESNTDWWTAWQGTLSRAAMASAPDGDYVAEVSCGCSSPRDYTLQSTGTSAGYITGTAGTRYTSEVWLRAASSSAVGKAAQLNIRERHGGTTDAYDVAVVPSGITLSDQWQEVTVSLVDKYSGDYLDVFVLMAGSPGDAFYADAFSLSPS